MERDTQDELVKAGIEEMELTVSFNGDREVKIIKVDVGSGNLEMNKTLHLMFNEVELASLSALTNMAVDTVTKALVDSAMKGE